MRIHRITVAIALSAIAIPAQTPSQYTAYIQKRYPQLEKLSVQRLVGDARAAFVVTTTEEIVELKAALRGLRSRKDRTSVSDNLRVDMPPAPAPTVRGLDVAVEIENNDVMALADDIAPDASTVSGDNGIADDVDTYLWTLTQPASVTATVTAVGAGPIVDSTLSLLAVGGQPIAFNDDGPGLGLLSQINVFLPAGQYHWQVGSYAGNGGGAYSLDVAIAPSTPTPCSGGVTGTTGTDTWFIAPFAPFDGTLDLAVTATNPAADLALALIHPDGTLVYYNDDAGGALDPRMLVGLPAANGYFLEVIDLAGGAEPYALVCSSTPNLPEACAAGVVTGSILGVEQADLYRVSLAAGGRVEFITGDDPASSNSIGDTIVAILDRDYRLIAEVDDSDPPGLLYLRLDINLPPGDYYLRVRGYVQSAGDYQLTANCALPPVSPGTFMPGLGNQATTALDGTVASHLLTVCQDDHHVFAMNGDYYGVIDSSGGSVVGSDIAASGQFPQERRLAAGDYFVLTYDRFPSPGIRTVDISPSTLFCDGNRDLVQLGKDGDAVVAIAGFFLQNPGIAVHPSVQGLLCIQNPATVNFLVMPSDGRVIYGNCGPGYTFYFQSATLGGPNNQIAPLIGIIAGVYFD